MQGGFKESPLRLNDELGTLNTWNESAIYQRAKRLAELAAQVWAPPVLTPEVLDAYRPEVKHPTGYTLDDHSHLALALLHGPEQIADLPVPVAESPGAVRIGHPERSHLVEYLAPNSVFNSLPRQRSSPHLRPDDRLVTIDRVLHHASLGVA